ncbi:glycosyltransferase [Streptomyces xanthochromogenes]|uniref:glycosyltransferase n=1 Tax=Streptomyces xanthochromogenes TaxID=67384 RepID=UPI0037F53C83
MRILLVTWGSTGDVAPYAGLAVQLLAARHQVVVATSERHAPAFRVHGMPVRVLPLARQEESALAADRYDRWQSPSRLRRRTRNGQDIAQVMASGVADAVREGVDAILAHPLAHPVCAMIAAATDLPCIGIYTVAPGMLLPRLSASPGLAPHGYRIAETLVHTAMRPLYAPALSWVGQEFGVRRGTARTVRAILRGRRVLYGFSRALLPKDVPLPDGHSCVGYWWPARDPRWSPDERLIDFLASGPAPVYFGFGSASPGSAECLSTTIKDAVRMLGVRAVVQTGVQGLNVSTDDVLTINECPHDWLFPRMSALVHHAGPGTAGAGLRAGVPAVPAPHAIDQHYWARRMTALGLAPTRLPARRITAPQLAGALRSTLHDEQYRNRSARLAQILRSENGAARVLSELAMPETGTPCPTSGRGRKPGPRG